MHTISYPTNAKDNRELCCECYVNENNPPADWHIVCMETYLRIKREKP